MGQILQSLSYKVCSSFLPKFLAIKWSILTLGKSAIFSQYLVAMLLRHQILVYSCCDFAHRLLCLGNRPVASLPTLCYVAISNLAVMPPPVYPIYLGLRFLCGIRKMHDNAKEFPFAKSIFRRDSTFCELQFPNALILFPIYRNCW